MNGVDLWMVLCRFGHFAALLPLAGGAVLMPGLAAGHPAPKGWVGAQTAMALLVTATAIFWLMLLAADFTGDPAAMLDPGQLWLVLSQTQFGHVWSLRLALCAVLLASLALPATRRRVLPIIAFLLLVTIGCTGHSADGGWLPQAAQILHLAAGGLWLGGLLVLVWLSALGSWPQDALCTALRRFSAIGIWLVAAIAVSGTANSWFLLTGPGDLVTSFYGRVLGLKILLVLGMLACAALNRLCLTSALASGHEKARPRLLASIGIETALGLAALAATALLGMLAPPGD